MSDVVDAVSGIKKAQLLADGFEVERQDDLKFQSKAVWTATTGPGVFGGQIMAQAVLSAAETVDAAYSLHYVQSYFVSAASKRTPIQYLVEILRDGRSYALRHVRAFQDGKLVVTVQCSFQKPDPLQPAFQLPMPEVSNPPGHYMTELDWFKEQLLVTKDNIARQYFQRSTVDLTDFPIESRFIEFRPDGQGGQMTLWWTKFTSEKVLQKLQNSDPSSSLALRKTILTFMSDDHNFNLFPMTALDLTFAEGPRQLIATQRASINHTITFFDHDFDCADWLLYVTTCPVAADGRGISTGRIYTRAGKLIAVTSQEGVFRIDTRKGDSAAKFKL
ncbi:hypothetical protein M422DRAFT_234803 [Sphaerobolus stellatus SS14]|uniref:Acyl-CoA thioesterase II n=1 Tax=Sphaerobolus stellatus (strain SS14) TaxID=990650 RepID=A0A0C9TL31_SPHS4|nr:hypothetical protein M422DRAFT_234803 [Sphaerobolus stellatus SS14]